LDHVTDVYEDGLINIIYSNSKPKYIMRTWINHLILCALNEDKDSKQSILLCKNAVYQFTFVSNALDLLKSLLDIYWQGISKPLHFYPESSFEYVLKIMSKNATRQAALKAAQRKWIGNDFTRGESEDPYFERCFSKMDPLNTDFENISMQIFSPLLCHCNEIEAISK